MDSLINDLSILESFTYGSDAYPVAQRVKKLVEEKFTSINIDYTAALEAELMRIVADGKASSDECDFHELATRLNAAIKGLRCGSQQWP